MPTKAEQCGWNGAGPCPVCGPRAGKGTHELLCPRCGGKPSSISATQATCGTCNLEFHPTNTAQTMVGAGFD